ncbi:DUF1223 domain-containing protein [Hyphococcus luteus]|nr:DUF1223 domain-containing protein [Marinicaulis flavus]
MGENRRISIRLHGKSAAAGFFFAAVLCAFPAQAQPREDAESPVLVELFLSQACNMCPPAAALFPKIAARDDVVALSWHVDYWNMTTSENGRWVDPFSEAAYTKRQKRYNMNIRHRSSIYTPQAIVNGAAQTVGASEEKIRELIEAAPDDGAKVFAHINKDGAVRFDIGKSEAGGNAYLVTFKKHVVTDITSGKNAGKTFDEVNVVTGMEPLGLVRRRGGDLTAPAPAEGEGCALIVQEPGQKGVVAAAYCPG